jgi:hypothetical protein
LDASSRKRKDEIKIIRLFNADGSVNKEAKAAIEQTLYPVNASDAEISNPKMNSAQLDSFFQLVQKLPYSEQQIFVTSAKKEEDEPSVREVINGRAKLNLFSLFKGTDSNNYQMDASIGMWVSAMEVCFREPVKPQIVIGISPPKDFFSSKTRILSVAYPSVEQPTEADGYRASGTDFLYHDWYHIDFVSHIPLSERERMNKVVLSIHKQMKITKEPLHKEFLDVLYSVLLDREFTAYEYEHLGLQDKFWYSLVASVVSTFSIIEEKSFGKWIEEKNKKKNSQFLENLFKTIAKLPYDPSFDTQTDVDRLNTRKFLKNTLETSKLTQQTNRTEETLRLIKSVDPAKIIYEQRQKICGGYRS